MQWKHPLTVQAHSSCRTACFNLGSPRLPPSPQTDVVLLTCGPSRCINQAIVAINWDSITHRQWSAVYSSPSTVWHANMAVPGGPLRVPASDADPVDDEWERFQANGCPDWWLLAKYVGQAAARFPYQPFKGVAGCSSPPGTQISNHADFEDAGMKQRMIQSLDLQQSSSKGPSAAACQQPASASGKDYKAGCSDVAVSSLQSPTAVPDAPSTMPGRSTAGAAAASAACGLKGMFGGCSGACVPPCAAAQADQAS